MDRYTIHCTEEQTRKAFNLGAPLEIGDDKGTILCRYQNYHTYKTCVIPTASQMIGWLEEQRLFIHIDYDFHVNDKPYKCEMCLLNGLTRHCGWFTSREEATIAAIDAALNHLIQH